MFICANSCPAGTQPSQYHDPCDAIRRRSGQGGLALIKCDKDWADYTDPVEWAAAVTAEDVIGLTAKGAKWGLAAPSVVTEEDGLGTIYEVEREYQISWETINVKRDSTDDVFFKRLFDQADNWTVVPMTADGKCYVQDAFFEDAVADVPTNAAAGYKLGYDVSFAVPPHEVYGDSTQTLVKWAFTLSIKRRGPMPGLFLTGIPELVI